MGQTVRTKLPCDDCGSSDAKAEYDDGSTFCFSCNVSHQNRNSNVTNYDKHLQQLHKETKMSNDMPRVLALWRNSLPVAIPDRCLPAHRVKDYGVVVEGDKQYYPYFDDSHDEPVGFKMRNTTNKGFVTVGNTKGCGLFGWQRYGNHDQRRVVVTEGELDAVAADEMFKGKVPVVSLRTGAAGAGRDFKEAYQWLDGFNEIILCFDADDAGKAGIEHAADVFAGKLRVMKWDSRLGKDACDLLKAGKQKEFTDAYWSAGLYTPKGVLSKEELLERLLAPRPRALGDYPWQPLNDLTYGFRPTELVTLCAGSGLGKSSILREIVMHIKNTTDARIGCLFMEESVERTAEGFMSVDLSTPLHLPHSTVERGSQAYLECYDRVYGNDQLYIMDASFDTGATVDEVVARVRFMAKALDCKVVILDHISILVSAGQHGDERRALDEIMTKLRTLTQDTGIVLFAVSHLKRPEGKGHEDGAATSISQLRGSASIAQLSDFVIGLERNGQAEDETERNTTRVRVLKNRFSGITGPAGYLLYNKDTGRLTDYYPEEALEETL